MRVTAEPDDDALAWAGDDDPSHVDGPSRQAQPKQAPDAAADKPTIGSMLLVTYGVLAGIYLIYTLGWVVSVQRSTTTLPTLFAEIMFQLGEFLAIVSPALWFAAVFALTRVQKLIVRLLWLLAGLVVVLPWPFILGG